MCPDTPVTAFARGGSLAGKCSPPHLMRHVAADRAVAPVPNRHPLSCVRPYGPVDKIVLRRDAERVIFVDTPSAILVDIDLRLRL